VSELLVDVHGLRTFRVSQDGNLLPVTAIDDSWRSGVCVATCRRRANHQAPVEGCTCGLYTFRSLGVLRSQYAPADLLVAVVALEGQTLAGSRGWRSQAGRVVSVWVAADALPEELTIALARNLPDVRMYRDLHVMMTHYPELSESAEVGGPDLTRTASGRRQARLPMRRNAVQLARVPLYVLGCALISWVFARAEQVPAAHIGNITQAIAAFGRTLAAHNQSVALPLLVVGLAIYGRATGTTLAKWLSVAVRVCIPLICASVIAAIITGAKIEINPLIITVAFMLWTHSRVLLSEMSNTDGLGSVFARRLLMARNTRSAALSGDGKTSGIIYQIHPLYSLGRYPLTIPVHLEPKKQ